MKLRTFDDLSACDSAYGPPPDCWTTHLGHRFHWIHTMRLAEWMGLSGRFGIVNAFITEGVGEVPVPEHPDL